MQTIVGVLLLGLAAAWTRDDPCPTDIEVTIPNNDTRSIRRYIYSWDDFDDEDEDEENGGSVYGNDIIPDLFRPLYGSRFATVSEVHECLLACRDTVKTLNLRASLQGCSEWPDRFNLPFDLAGGEKYPALEELTIEGYMFDQRIWESVKPGGDKLGKYIQYDNHPWSLSWGQQFWYSKARQWDAWRHLPTSQRLKTNLDLWLDAMDVSRLRSLMLNDDGTSSMKGDALVRRLPGALVNLESLSITGSWRWDREAGDAGQVRDFLLNVSPKASLTSLSWVDGNTCDDELFEAILGRHGSSLTSLEWRTSELKAPVRPVFSASQLRRLASMAPKLRSLAIDMNRDEDAADWPRRDLEILASSHPALTHLTIYWDLQSACRRASYRNPDVPGPCTEPCSGLDQLASPRLDAAEAEALFALLRSAKAGEELTRVTFRAGDFTRAWDGPVYIPEWLEGRLVWVDCSVLREDGSRKSEDEALCRGEDHSLNVADARWMNQCSVTIGAPTAVSYW